MFFCKNNSRILFCEKKYLTLLIEMLYIYEDVFE